MVVWYPMRRLIALDNWAASSKKSFCRFIAICMLTFFISSGVIAAGHPADQQGDSGPKEIAEASRLSAASAGPAILTGWCSEGTSSAGGQTTGLFFGLGNFSLSQAQCFNGKSVGGFGGLGAMGLRLVSGGTLQNLSVFADRTQGIIGYVLVQVFVNSGPTAIKCSVSQSVFSCSDKTHAAVLNAGDSISVQMTGTNNQSANIGVTMEKQ